MHYHIAKNAGTTLRSVDSTTRARRDGTGGGPGKKANMLLPWQPAGLALAWLAAPVAWLRLLRTWPVPLAYAWPALGLALAGGGTGRDLALAWNGLAPWPTLATRPLN